MLFLISSLFNQIKSIQHGFFSKLREVNQEESSLPNRNTPSNIEKITKSFNCTNNVKFLRQIHSNKVIIVENPSQICSNIEADALVTRLPQVLLAIKTADCVPILFCDPENNIIGAAHAGWRGALAGIIENTIEQLMKLGAKHIHAVIGPCIRVQNYEVNQDFHQNAIKINLKSLNFFTDGHKKDHYQFDLPNYCSSILKESGVNVDDLEIDTYSNPQLFFSYRRAYHNTKSGHAVKYGNQVSAIIIAKAFNLHIGV
ncbi:MAG: peptidoglycan editing factor PgeF [Candidatus Midichloria sp.]|nr:MAG: peptidoglycan editing factor PgeF [Candidatus Midichloria sp.]